MRSIFLHWLQCLGSLSGLELPSHFIVLHHPSEFLVMSVVTMISNSVAGRRSMPTIVATTTQVLELLDYIAPILFVSVMKEHSVPKPQLIVSANFIVRFMTSSPSTVVVMLVVKVPSLLLIVFILLPSPVRMMNITDMEGMKSVVFGRGRTLSNFIIRLIVDGRVITT